LLDSLNLEKEILEYCYLTNLSTEEYFHNFTIEELVKDKRFEAVDPNKILYSLYQLEKANYIEKMTSLDTYFFQISLEGIHFLEKTYLKEDQIFILLTVDVLDFIKKIEEQKIKLHPGEGEQVGSFPIEEFIDMIGRDKKVEMNKLDFIIHGLSTYEESKSFIYFNSLGFSGEKLIFFRTLLLTSKGRKFLNYYQKLRNLFQSINDNYAKEILLEEYNEIEYLRKREKWKDAVIKMGTILEYLITNYFIENDMEKKNEIRIRGKKKIIIPSQANFAEKLSFIIQYEIFGREKNNDWSIVNRLIVYLRNYIHLQEYIKDRIRVNEDIFTQLYSVFERLILLF